MERRKRASVYQGIPGHDVLHKLHGSMNAWQEYMRQWAGKDRVCMSYNELMSIHPGIFRNTYFLMLSPFQFSLYLCMLFI